MPLYDYKCKKCGHRFEKIQLFSDAPIKHCPECGGGVEKMLTAPAVHFKGSGFYGTDYAKKGNSGESSSGENSKSSEETASSAKLQSAGTNGPESKSKPKSEPSEKKSPKK